MDEEEKAMVAEANAEPGNMAPPPQPVDEDDDEPMKIVKDYQRPVARYHIIAILLKLHSSRIPTLQTGVDLHLSSQICLSLSSARLHHGPEPQGTASSSW